MRLALGSFLRQLADLYRPGNVKNDITGKELETWELFTEGISCLLQPVTGKQKVMLDGFKLTANFVIFCAYTEDIRARDKLVVNSKTYMVEYVATGWSGLEDYKEVYLRILEETLG